ncbi:DUF975 family protein [Streptococcus sp. zg-JUN1979]|uniref:DUF975 family protein n=1 Tax=Streptococcus sp. zg-JUN1979 TaxID=3391450 RepID=UPI0039A751FA
MRTRAVLKEDAKQLLRGNWWSAISLVSLSMLAMWLLSIVVTYTLAGTFALPFLGIGMLSELGSWLEAFGIVAAIFWGIGIALVSFAFGIFSMMLKVGMAAEILDWQAHPQGKQVGFKGAFRYFTKDDFVPVFILCFKIYLYLFLWGLIPVIGWIIVLVKALAYFQAPFLYARYGKTMTSGELLTRSRQLMDGYKGDLAILLVSFIGWFILANISFGIGFIWLLPYVAVTLTLFAKDVADAKA